MTANGPLFLDYQPIPPNEGDPMSSQFFRDAAERAAKSFSYAVIACFGIGDGFDAFHADWGNALSLGCGSAVLSLLGSVASYKFGNSGTASLTTAVEPAGRHAAPDAA